MPEEDEVNWSPSVEDDVVVGNPKILSSPHVSEGPGHVAKAPVPSVYVDDRGDIHRLRVGHKRINLLYSKKGVMRSGYLHPNTTHDFVINGKVEVWRLTPTQTEKTIYGPCEHFEIAPYVPHILNFLEDTSLLEWWSHGAETQCWVYHPYRKIIDIQNANLNKGVGRHQRLIPQDDQLLMDGSSFSSSRKKNNNGNESSVFWWTAASGFFVGVLLGAAFVVTQQERSPSPRR